MADTLPKGTDHSLSDADAARETATDAHDQVKAAAGDFRERAQSTFEDVRAQAGDRVRDYAEQGKERASGVLGELARLLGDNASHVDDALGAQYGDYIRRAADAVTGASDSLRDKDVDDLVEDVRTLVRRSPGLAIGAAAAAGFLLARVVKSGSEALDATARATQAADADRAPARKAKHAVDASSDD